MQMSFYLLFLVRARMKILLNNVTLPSAGRNVDNPPGGKQGLPNTKLLLDFLR